MKLENSPIEVVVFSHNYMYCFWTRTDTGKKIRAELALEYDRSMETLMEKKKLRWKGTTRLHVFRSPDLMKKINRHRNNHETLS